ncbi:hypothetical protein J6590_071506 [Homalodisca vitripennis]|nr:hypothetical protein J6590_071506 [Homalodisca vitripennis]
MSCGYRICEDNRINLSYVAQQVPAVERWIPRYELHFSDSNHIRILRSYAPRSNDHNLVMNMFKKDSHVLKVLEEDTTEIYPHGRRSSAHNLVKFQIIRRQNEVKTVVLREEIISKKLSRRISLD